jgi:hypothetical protein
MQATVKDCLTRVDGTMLCVRHPIEIHLPPRRAGSQWPILIGAFKCCCLRCGARHFALVEAASCVKVQCPDCGWSLELSTKTWWGRFGQWLLRPVSRICLGVFHDSGEVRQ